MQSMWKVQILCFIPWSIQKEVSQLMFSETPMYVSKHVSEYI